MLDPWVLDAVLWLAAASLRLSWWRMKYQPYVAQTPTGLAVAYGIGAIVGATVWWLNPTDLATVWAGCAVANLCTASAHAVYHLRLIPKDSAWAMVHVTELMYLPLVMVHPWMSIYYDWMRVVWVITLGTVSIVYADRLLPRWAGNAPPTPMPVRLVWVTSPTITATTSAPAA